MKLEDLELSDRARICVERFGITSVEELCERMEAFERHAPTLSKEVKAALEAVQKKEGGRTNE